MLPQLLASTSWRHLLKHAFLLWGILTFACKPKTDLVASSSPPPPVYFSKNWKAEIGFPYYNGCRIMRAETGELSACLPTSNGLLQSTSMDNGKSWTLPRMIFVHQGQFFPVYLKGQLLGAIAMEKVANGGQMYFYKRDGEDWAAPSPIRDTNWGDFIPSGFAGDSLNNFYCAWIDWREGNPDIYFSSSWDGGKTWTANVRVDDDQTGQEQDDCTLIAAPQGSLYAFWADNRDPKTLFDIYCSSSQDGGKTWRPSLKVNDDTTHTFQFAPSAAVDNKGNLYVVWGDYRDKGVSGDILPNIYFARSEDGGRSWHPNIRISHAQYGHNVSPILTLAPNGQLHGLWMSTENYTRFDIFYSYSRDGGQIWSEPVRVNDDLEQVGHDHRGIGWLGSDSQGNPIIGWLDWRDRQPAVYMAQALEDSDTAHAERKPQQHVAVNAARPVLSIEPGATLFQDNFAEGPSPQWKAQSGIWVCKDQTYIGYGAREAQSFAGSELWNNYIFQGRFKLDPIDHRTAFVYLRVTKDQEGRLRYYRLNNYFRIGVKLEYFDGKTQLPLADIPYSFQKDRWYTFRTVVKGSVLNHFINDSLLIATDKLIQSPRGRVGVGAFATPTYFKDIVVTAIK